MRCRHFKVVVVVVKRSVEECGSSCQNTTTLPNSSSSTLHNIIPSRGQIATRFRRVVAVTRGKHEARRPKKSNILPSSKKFVKIRVIRCHHSRVVHKRKLNNQQIKVQNNRPSCTTCFFKQQSKKERDIQRKCNEVGKYLGEDIMEQGINN